MRFPMVNHFHRNHFPHKNGVNGDQVTDVPLISPGVVIKTDTLTIFRACHRHGCIVNTAAYAKGLSDGKHSTVNRFGKSGEKENQGNHYEKKSFHIIPPIQDIAYCPIEKMQLSIFQKAFKFVLRL